MLCWYIVHEPVFLLIYLTIDNPVNPEYFRICLKTYSGKPLHSGFDIFVVIMQIILATPMLCLHVFVVQMERSHHTFWHGQTKM